MTYLIKNGSKYSTPNIFDTNINLVKGVSLTVTFHEDCKYYYPTKSDQNCWMKASGFAYGTFSNDSARLGWRYKDTGVLELFPYLHEKGKWVKPTKPSQWIMSPFQFEKPIHCNILYDAPNATVQYDATQVAGDTVIRITRNVPWNATPRMGYMSAIYFEAGDKPANRDMHIDLTYTKLY